MQSLETFKQSLPYHDVSTTAEGTFVTQQDRGEHFSWPGNLLPQLHKLSLAYLTTGDQSWLQALCP